MSNNNIIEDWINSNLEGINMLNPPPLVQADYRFDKDKNQTYEFPTSILGVDSLDHIEKIIISLQDIYTNSVHFKISIVFKPIDKNDDLAQLILQAYVANQQVYLTDDLFLRWGRFNIPRGIRLFKLKKINPVHGYVIISNPDPSPEQ